jgi:hydroxyacylglutathione hydrolase
MPLSSRRSDLVVTPVPAFNDNYLWLFERDGNAVVVDPGDAEPVRQTLGRRGLRLAAILVTHHHADHVGGVAALKAASGAFVYGPASERIAGVDQRLAGGDRVRVLDVDFDIIDVPGHTAGHIAYYAAAEQPPLLFCGDTLFACGCGRLFEGTPKQMVASLDALSALPPTTRVYCAHEYTLANIRFALTVEPGNDELQRRAVRDQATRARNEPTLPSTIGLELATNPFLRCESPEIRRAVLGAADGTSDRTDVFAQLREKKNRFA